MMNLTKVVTEHRRLAILRTLDELGYNLNEDVIHQALAEMSLASVSKDMVRADLAYLEEHALIRIDRLQKANGQMWIAHLHVAGKEVANGRPHVGVAQRQPDC